MQKMKNIWFLRIKNFFDAPVLNFIDVTGNMFLHSIRTAAFFLIFMIGIAVSLTACGRNCFVGRRTAGVDFYRLDIECMNGTDSFTMELSAGDMLEVQFETVRGSACMEIKEANGNSLYTGNGRDVTAFTVNISKCGTYFIYVEAHHAKGTLHIQRKMRKKMYIKRGEENEYKQRK